MKAHPRLLWLSLLLLLFGFALPAQAAPAQMPDASDPIYLPFIGREWTPPTPTCQPIFFDDFSNPASGWPVLDAGNYRLEYLGGEYRILLRVDLDVAAARPGALFDNFIVAVDARRQNITDGTWGLIFGANDDWTQMYTFEIGPTQDFYLWRYTAGAWSVLTQGTSAYINPANDVNRLKVERNGGSIKIYANGQLLREVTNTAYTGLRYVGLVATTYDETNLDVRYDNFAVYPVSCGPGATVAPRIRGEGASQLFSALPATTDKLPNR